jgi:tetratricopeptide (TPR) repeat protein/predicted Ser/Thr protein kinase
MPPEPRETPPLRRVSHFVLLEQIGAGGMGVVFAAFDERLERKVAIKLVRPQGQADWQERLVREAQALARLSHPNVVSIYEVGELAEGGVFIAMEFIKGENLRRWQAAPHRTWREVLATYVLAGLGLAAAHRAGVVHRDFKPDNVLVGDDGRVRVVDFGLALAALPSTALAAAVTPPEAGPAWAQPSTIAGTPGYIAPEQLHLRALDTRSDQFSFCVALYEALYGERPFANRAFSSDPSTVPARRERPKELHARWLWEVLDRGLALDPAARFPSMEALLRELTRDHGRARRRLALAGAAVAMLAATGLTAARLRAEPPCPLDPAQLAGTWDKAQLERVRSAILGTQLPYAPVVATAVEAAFDRYASQWLQARKDACEATHVHHTQSADLLDRRMECLAGRKGSLQATAEAFVSVPAQAASNSAALLEGLEDITLCADPALLRQGLPPPPDTRTAAEVGQVRQGLARGKALIAAGDLPGAAKEFGTAEQLAAQVRYPPLRAEVLHAQGTLQAARGELAAGVATLYDAIQAATEHRHDELLADAWLSLARDASLKHRSLDEAWAWVRQADAWRRRLHPTGGLPLLAVELARGHVQVASGQHREAAATFDRAIDAASALGVEEAQLVRLLRGRAIALTALGEGKKALADHQRVLAITRAVWGDNHPETAITRRALGLLLIERLGAVAEGEHELEEALRIFRASHGPDSAHVAECEQALSMAGMFRGDYVSALAHAERAEALFSRQLGATHRHRGEALMAMGVLRFMTKDYAGSLQAYQQARGILEASLGAEHNDVGFLLSNMGETLLALGDADAALQHFEKALAVLRKIWGPEHPNLATPLKGLGLACLERGRHALALDALEQALALRERSGPGDPQELAETRWALARTLAALGRTPERRHSLASAALETYRTLGPEWSGRVREIARFLDTPLLGR